MAKFIGNTDIIDGIAGVVEASSGAVSKEAVFNAIENSIADIMRQKYGINSNIIVKMNRNSGEVQIHRIMLVVEAVNDFDNEIDLNRAKMYNAEAKIGDSLDESLPHLHIERSIVSNMRDTILREIKSLEREAEYREFNTKIGQMFTGYVKKATKYNAIIAIGQKTEAIILKDGLIPGERLNEGDKITAIIQEVKRSDTEFQIILSRSSNEFLMRMLRDEVPEIDDNLIEIKGIVRDPGSRAKVAVFSPDNKVDAVGACIGPRGSRIKNLVNELKNEKIDIVSWSRDIETYIKNAMVPAKVIKINMEKQDGKDKAEVIVAEDQINIAIGRRGQNVRLVAKLAGVDIEILSETDKQANAMAKFKDAVTKIMTSLDVDEIVAQLLVADGYASVNSIAHATIEALSKINGFDANISQAIKTRAEECVTTMDKKYRDLLKQHSLEDGLDKLPVLQVEDKITLITGDVKTLQDVADLSSMELLDVLPTSGITKKQADKIVMAARKIVYDIDAAE